LPVNFDLETRFIYLNFSGALYMNALMTIADLAVSQDLDRNALATITGAGYYQYLNAGYTYGSFGSYYGGEWVSGDLYSSTGAKYRQIRWKRDRVQTEVSLWNYFF
jgi:hypothetical protein